MTQTREQVEKERDALREDLTKQRAAVNLLRGEVETLRARLADGGGKKAAPAAEHEFVMNQGQLSELETYGVTTVSGRQVTTEQVREMLTGDQAGMAIAEPSNPQPPLPLVDRGAAVYGVDFVYPSVRPGEIDPEVAGTPGINGPAAASK